MTNLYLLSHMPTTPTHSLHQRRFVAVVAVAAGYCTVMALGVWIRLELERWGFVLTEHERRTAVQTSWLHAGLALGLGIMLATQRYSARLRRGAGASAAWSRMAMTVLPLLLVASLDRIAAIGALPNPRRVEVLRHHPIRGWTMRPHWTGVIMGQPVRTNALGFRGEEMAAGKDPDEWRLMVLGDSVTFGYGLREEDSLPVQLAGAMIGRAGGKRVTVINAGTTTYSPWQEALLLDECAAAVKPDIVIHVFCLNDVVERYQLLRFGGYSPGPLRPEPALMEASGLYRWARLAISSAVGWSRREIAEHNRKYSLARLYDYPSPPQIEDAWRTTLDEMKGLMEAAHRHQAPLVVVCFPTALQLTYHDPTYAQPQERLRSFTEEQRVVFLDLLPAFREAERSRLPDAPQYFWDEIHPTAPGNAVAATALARYLNENFAPR